MKAYYSQLRAKALVGEIVCSAGHGSAIQLTANKGTNTLANRLACPLTLTISGQINFH